MRKLITACVLAAFIATAFVGCTKSISHIKTRKPAADEEPSITKVTDEMDKELENKLKAIDDMGKDVIDNIRTEASKAVSEIRAAITTTAKTTEPYKILQLNNVMSNYSGGTLKFTKAKIDYGRGAIELYCRQVSHEREGEHFDLSRTYIVDAKGNKLDCFSGMGLGGHKFIYDKGDNDKIVGFEKDTGMQFRYANENDLSTVTLTYAFEGFDPVTVTFDIPV